VALVAMAVAAVGTVYASTPNPVVVDPPSNLAALARRTSDATLLHEIDDGVTTLYIEKNQDARLASVDVTGPLGIKGEGSIYFGLSPLFDFVFPEGNQAQMVRFLQGPEDEVLDIPTVAAPTLLAAHGLTLPGSMTAAPTVTRPTIDASRALDFGVIDPVLTYELNRLFNVEQVRAPMTRTDTGTTFMLNRRRPIAD